LIAPPGSKKPALGGEAKDGQEWIEQLLSAITSPAGQALVRVFVSSITKQVVATICESDIVANIVRETADCKAQLKLEREKDQAEWDSSKIERLNDIRLQEKRKEGAS